jgi:transposase InsO family protein
VFAQHCWIQTFPLLSQIRPALQAKDEVVDWLRFYNSRRLHSTLGFLSPMDFEKKQLAEKERLVA